MIYREIQQTSDLINNYPIANFYISVCELHKNIVYRTWTINNMDIPTFFCLINYPIVTEIMKYFYYDMN